MVRCKAGEILRSEAYMSTLQRRRVKPNAADGRLSTASSAGMTGMGVGTGMDLPVLPSVGSDYQ